ncbi:CarD family transcriptional regulator [Domibacillus iocasae]|uniref:Transcription factor YdeB n=1 Tax=Domibacillus iocasae TaxID=1714016 RepID=A0A1E7DU15_9BACI|nr:CarD family transcriptional regulator [Domibacillus iocasae]OES46577.1 transcription factor YdeB [Domibacillus iocasae]
MEVDHLFEIGDKIVYPMHGAGVIKAIEEKEIQGKTQQYFIMVFPVRKLQLMLPIAKMDDSGMRLVLNMTAIEKVMDMFRQGEIDRSLTYKQRYKINTDKMKTGKTQDGAEVIRDLMLVKKEKALNSNEKMMLREAMQFLISELELSNSMTEMQAADLLNDRLNVEKDAG